MILRWLAAGLLAAGALGVTACAGDAGSSSAADAKSRQQRNEEALLQFARCMRQQGIDFPDPKGDENGFTVIGPGKGPRPSEAKMRAAEKRCEKYRAALEPPKLTEEQQKEMREAALANARCMREHGVDFPDPQFDERGRASVRIGRGGVDPNDPDFRKAEKACRRLLPGGGARSVGP